MSNECSEFFGENHYFVRAIVLEIGREEFLSTESHCCLDRSLSLSRFLPLPLFLFYSRFNWNPVLRFVQSARIGGKHGGQTPAGSTFVNR